MFEGGDGLVDLEAPQALAVDVDDFVADAQPPVPGEEGKEERKLMRAVQWGNWCVAGW